MSAAPKLDPYAERFPIKIAAQEAVARAIRLGKMKRQPCEDCGSDLTIAHHRDYAKPLEVAWLCHACHSAWHRHNGPGLNGGDAPMGWVPGVPRNNWTGLSAYAEMFRKWGDMYPPNWLDLDDAYLGPLSVDLTYFDEYRGLGTDIIGVGGHAGFYDERVGS